MNVYVKSIEDLMKELPPDAQAEVRDFAEFLIEKKKRKKPGFVRQNWAGALRACQHKYTSLDLQQKALEWRGA